MRDLKPTVFEDLIAMNALYRPGPMDYIPSFINRKHGKQKIIYDLARNGRIPCRNLWDYGVSGASDVALSKVSRILPKVKQTY